MSTTEFDPGQTETQETTAAVPMGSGPEAEGEQSPQALWDQSASGITDAGGRYYRF